MTEYLIQFLVALNVQMIISLRTGPARHSSESGPVVENTPEAFLPLKSRGCHKNGNVRDQEIVLVSGDA